MKNSHPVQPQPRTTKPLSRLTRWQMYQERSSVEEVSKRTALIFASLWFVLIVSTMTVVLAHSISGFLVLLIITAVVSTCLGYAFYGLCLHLIPKQRKRLDDRVGQALSGDDRVALWRWFKTGNEPQAKHLQPALRPYLDYLELNSYSVAQISFKQRLFMFMIYVLLTVQTVIRLFTESNDRILHIITTTLFIFGLLIYLPLKDGAHNPFISLLSRNRLKKIASMRQQLKG